MPCIRPIYHFFNWVTSLSICSQPCLTCSVSTVTCLSILNWVCLKKKWVWLCLWSSFFGSVNKNSDSHFTSRLVCSVTQPCLTLCDPMDCSTLRFPIHHQLPEFTQTHVHCVGDAIQPSHPLSSPSPPAFNLFQHQGLFQWVSSSHQVAKVLEFQLQHQSFQWTFRTDFF